MNFWQLWSCMLDGRGTSGTFDTHIEIWYFYHMSFIICHIWHNCQICRIKTISYDIYVKIIYANMGVKSYVRTSTMQPVAPKLSKVHFNILNLKNKIWSDFLCIFRNFLCIFDVIFSSTNILKIIHGPHQCKHVHTKAYMDTSIAYIDTLSTYMDTHRAQMDTISA